MREPLFQTVEELISHRAPMILIDEITDWGEDFVEAAIYHQRRHSFWDADNRIPAYVGLEYMAQSISAYSGIQAKLADQPIRIGLLLGTRSYQSNVSHFTAGQAIKVRVALDYRNEDNMSVFDCSIVGDTIKIKSLIKAIQPHNIEDILLNT